MVLFKNPRDKLQISVLARQMYSDNSKYFLECFWDATARPFGYLLVDLKAQTPEELCLQSGVFPWEKLIVYVPKKKKKP